jgi:hypothetical protein
MSPLELVLFYVGFWGFILLLTSTVDACNSATDRLLNESVDAEQGQACCDDAYDEPEQRGTVPRL